MDLVLPVVVPVSTDFLMPAARVNLAEIVKLVWVKEFVHRAMTADI